MHREGVNPRGEQKLLKHLDLPMERTQSSSKCTNIQGDVKRAFKVKVTRSSCPIKIMVAHGCSDNMRDPYQDKWDFISSIRPIAFLGTLHPAIHEGNGSPMAQFQAFLEAVSPVRGCPHKLKLSKTCDQGQTPCLSIQLSTSHVQPTFETVPAKSKGHSQAIIWNSLWEPWPNYKVTQQSCHWPNTNVNELPWLHQGYIQLSAVVVPKDEHSPQHCHQGTDGNSSTQPPLQSDRTMESLYGVAKDCP
ncbi:hypothetical protein BS47DRAFT_1369206 [Hydnum rufescens UP504]|uniref:Uncharacterized protein n=1 Tax=Hydnum rufescens UP504 TaxID=1448309 RepID=A0A9P6AEI3_9AGAM|nr:hypothetical protein BS47DRAFT_1369206 [Hydnum rufescens UP504]